MIALALLAALAVMDSDTVDTTRWLPMPCIVCKPYFLRWPICRVVERGDSLYFYLEPDLREVGAWWAERWTP